MRSLVGQYIIVLLVFLAIDSTWLMTAGRTLYVQEIGGLLRDKPNLVVALCFYLVYAAGLLVFAVMPGLSSENLWRSALLGGFFGLVAYATYDMTNLATIKGFTLKIALIDMAWGAVLSAAVTAGAIALIRLFKLA